MPLSDSDECDSNTDICSSTQPDSDYAFADAGSKVVYNYDSFMTNHVRRANQSITHTSMGKPFNAYHIEPDATQQFHRLYAAYIENGGKPYLVERPLVTSKHEYANTYLKPFLIDLDLRYEGALPDGRDHYFHTPPNIGVMEVDTKNYVALLDNVIRLVEEIYALIRAKFIMKFNDNVTVKHSFFIMERLSAREGTLDVNGKMTYKDGVHIVSPDLMMTIGEQLAIRQLICDMFVNSPCKLPGLSAVVKYSKNNDGIYDIYDQSVIDHGSWTMYYSTKENKDPYLTKVVTTFTTSSKKPGVYVTKSLSYDNWLDVNAKVLKTNPLELIVYEVSHLSIRRTVEDLDYRMEPHEDFKGMIPTYIHITDEVPMTTAKITLSGNVERDNLRLCLMNLHIKRATQYADWFKINTILVDAAIEDPENYEDYYTMWFDFSSRARNYDHRGCDQLWHSTYKKQRSSLNTKSTITKATLFHWLKDDNSAVFESMKRTSPIKTTNTTLPINIPIPYEIINNLVELYSNSMRKKNEITNDMYTLCNLFNCFDDKIWFSESKIDAIHRVIYTRFGDKIQPLWKYFITKYAKCHYNLDKWIRNDCSQTNANNDNEIVEYELNGFINETREFYAPMFSSIVINASDKLLFNEIINQHPIDFMPASILFTNPSGARPQIEYYLHAFIASKCSGMIIPSYDQKGKTLYVCGEGMYSNLPGKHQCWVLSTEQAIAGKVGEAYHSFLLEGIKKCSYNAQEAIYTGHFEELKNSLESDNADTTVADKLATLGRTPTIIKLRERYLDFQNLSLEAQAQLEGEINKCYNLRTTGSKRSTASKRSEAGDEGGIYITDRLDIKRPIIFSSVSEVEELRRRYTKAKLAQLVPTEKINSIIMKVANDRNYIVDTSRYHIRDKFDQNPKFFAFTNCIIDSSIDASKPFIRGAQMADFISRTTDYPLRYPGSIHRKYCTMFDEFFSKIMPDNETFRYMMVTFGAIITGTPLEQALYLWYGPTASNGKSTAIAVLQAAFKGVETSLSHGVMFSNNTYVNDGSGATPELAKLAGVKFAQIPEVTSNMVYNASMMKILASPGEKVTSRGLYQESRDVTIQAQIHLVCNSLPTMPSGFDEGIIRRLIIFMFESRFVDKLPSGKKEGDDGLYLRKDAMTPDDLDHVKQVFIWMALAHWTDYKKSGKPLLKPSKTEYIVNEFIERSNNIKNFIIENYEVDPEYIEFYKNINTHGVTLIEDQYLKLTKDLPDTEFCVRRDQLIQDVKTYINNQRSNTFSTGIDNADMIMKSLYGIIGFGYVKDDPNCSKKPAFYGLSKRGTDPDNIYFSEIVKKQQIGQVQPRKVDRQYAVDRCVSLEKCGVYIESEIVAPLNFKSESNMEKSYIGMRFPEVPSVITSPMSKTKVSKQIDMAETNVQKPPIAKTNDNVSSQFTKLNAPSVNLNNIAVNTTLNAISPPQPAFKALATKNKTFIKTNRKVNENEFIDIDFDEM